MRDGTGRGRRPRVMVAAATVVLVGIAGSGVRVAAPATATAAGTARQPTATAGWPLRVRTSTTHAPRSVARSRARTSTAADAFTAERPALRCRRPLVVDTVYFQGGSGVVVAIDADPARRAGTVPRPVSTSARSVSRSPTAACTPTTAPMACWRSTGEPGRSCGARAVDHRRPSASTSSRPCSTASCSRHGAGEHPRHLHAGRPRRDLRARRRNRRGALDVRHGEGRPVGPPGDQLRRRCVVSARRSTPSAASCTSAPRTRRRSPARPSIRTARAGRATTSTPTRSSRSTSRPASCAGTTR